MPRHEEFEFVPKPTKLEFVHITKTGGTAIEEAAARSIGTRRHIGFETIPIAVVIPTIVTFPSIFYCKHYGYYRGSGETTSSTTTVDPKDGRLRRFQELTKQKKDFEARKAAQVKQHGGRRLVMEADNGDDKDGIRTQMNDWPLHQLKMYQVLTGHMLPQHDYVYDSNGKQVITHVLEFETLAEDFEALMQRYNLPVRLPMEHINARQATERLTRKDLSAQVVTEINKFAHDDFRFFGYHMMD